MRPPDRASWPWAWSVAWACALVAAAVALQRPGPLFFNVGAGDATHTRGFREWERDGLRGAGETTFRWTQDGARLVFPVTVLTGRLDARLRLARFQDPPVEVRLRAAEREVARWTQDRRAWRVRTVLLEEHRGPLVLQFRSTDAEPLGVALDWVEVSGAGRILPAPDRFPGLAAWLLGVPVGVGLLLGRRLAALVAGTTVAGLAAVAVGFDRLGGLVAVSHAGLPALAVVLLTWAAFRAVGRAWPDLLGEPRLLGLALAGPLVALLALSHPAFHYPDVDTHAGYLAAIRGHPLLAWDAAEYQQREGAWTREIAGRRVAFPYSAAFHLAAWPLAVVLGDVTAVKTLAVLSLAVTTLLAGAYARSAGRSPAEAFVAQGLLLLLPVTASRLCLALYPALFGQALDLLLLVHLLRSWARPDGPSRGPTLLLLAVAQAAYPASLFNVGAFVGLVVLSDLAAGDRRRARRLLLTYLVAAAAVVGLLYGRFLPVLFRDVLPHAGVPSPALSAEGLRAWGRLRLFYDFVYPLLVPLGLLALRVAPRPAVRLVESALAAGLTLLVLREVAPGVFRDAKEVEWLAPSVAVVAAAGLGNLARRGHLGRGAAAALWLAASAWGALRAVHVYAERFVAVGR